MKRWIFLALVAQATVTGPVQAQAPDIVRAHEAIDHVGELAMVCGVIATAKHAQSTRGAPTYLNFDKPFPDSEFTAIIWGQDRKAFDLPPEKLDGYKACVYGEVEVYRGKAQITVRRREQLNYAEP